MPTVGAAGTQYKLVSFNADSGSCLVVCMQNFVTSPVHSTIGSWRGFLWRRNRPHIAGRTEV